MSRLRVAIQKSGRLSEKSLDVLKSCGLSFARSKDKLFWYGRDFPVDVLLVRDDDLDAARRALGDMAGCTDRNGGRFEIRATCLVKADVSMSAGRSLRTRSWRSGR